MTATADPPVFRPVPAPTVDDLSAAGVAAFPRVLRAHGIDPESLTDQDRLMVELARCADLVAYVSLRVRAMNDTAAADADEFAALGLSACEVAE